jgi:hypothetical protein
MANLVDPAVPQYWANEALDFLYSVSVAANAVNRQYAPALSRAGDQVNAYRPAKRDTRRKTAAGEYTDTDANLIAVPVVLDQYFFDSIVIKDEEQAKALPDLFRTHVRPMVEGIARGIERAILGRVVSFLRQGTPEKRAGKLEKIDSTNGAAFLLEAEEVLQDNLAPLEGLRTAIVHQSVNTYLMQVDGFQHADKRGEPGTTMVGEVGTVFNTRILRSQNVNHVILNKADTTSTAINNAAGYPAAHATTMAVDAVTAGVVGEYMVVDGNDQPTYATAIGTSLITLNEPLKYPVLDNAIVTVYEKCVNEAVQREPGYQEELTFTVSSGKHLQVGQVLSFGTTTRYDYTVINATVVDATHTKVLLDRPLEAVVASAADAFPGPAGAMCPVLDRDAIALVTRNMDPATAGANTGVASWEGLAIRVVVQYEAKAGGHRVNVDLLAGISVLDEDLLCVMCA